LEVEHYDVIFHHFAVRNTARYSEALYDITPEQRYDWQIFEALRVRMTGKTGKSPRERLDAGLRAGAYGTSLDELRGNPHGIDYGPMRPSLPDRLLTADARVKLAPPAFVADLARLESELAAPVPELVLIGRRQLRSNNSWMHNAPRLMRGPDRCTLMINPRDARARGIETGARLRPRARRGWPNTRRSKTRREPQRPYGPGAPRRAHGQRRPERRPGRGLPSPCESRRGGTAR